MYIPLKFLKTLFFIGIITFILLLFVKSNFTYGDTVKTLDKSIQWQFFHEQWISPENAKSMYGKGEDVTIPHKLKDRYGSKTYGTYVGKMRFPRHYVGKNLAAFIPFEYGNYKLYINDQRVLASGQLSSNPNVMIQMKPQYGAFHLKEQEAYIVLQLSNFSSIRGGFAQPIQIGDYEDVQKKFQTSIIAYFVIVGMIFILGAFLMILAFASTHNTFAYLQAGICILLATRTFFARPFLYSLTSLQISWEQATKIESLLTLMALALFLRLAAEIIRAYVPHKYFIVGYSVLLIQANFVIWTEPIIFQQTLLYCFIIYMCYLPLFIYIFIRHLRAFSIYEKLYVVTILILAVALITDMMTIYKVAGKALYFNLALLIYATIQLTMLGHRYAQKLNEVLKLNRDVVTLNTSLDEKVQQRTKELKQANTQLQKIASIDALTNISNRYTFDMCLMEQFENMKRSNHYLTLYMIDLDFFKKYNDYYGHVAGDELLQKLVKIIAVNLPEDAIFARYGGEEFAIIFLSPTPVETLGVELVQAVAAQRVEHVKSESGIVTISMGGYAICAEDGFTHPSDLVRAADKQLYTAKYNGKNQFCFDMAGKFNKPVEV